MISPYQDDQLNQRGDVEGLGGQPGQPADGLQRADAVGQDAGGDDDQEDAGVGEELGQVDAQRAAVHAVGDGAGDQHADDEPDQRPVGCRLGVPDHEQGGFDAFAADGEERQQRDGQRAGLEGLGHVGAQSARHSGGGPCASRAPSW